jgi:hypothetical protein
VTSSFYFDAESATVAVAAGTWTPDIPAACGDLAQYQEIVIYGTDGPDDPLPLGGEHPPPGNDNRPDPQPGNKGQVILGLGGDDVIYGGNAKDCLVGGPGDDIIYGNNGSDIILGGLGHDTLYGDNGPDSLDGGDDDDYLDGGKGPDECVGGSGEDQLVSCNEPDPGDAGGLPATQDPSKQDVAEGAAPDVESQSDVSTDATGDEAAAEEQAPEVPSAPDASIPTDPDGDVAQDGGLTDPQAPAQ